MTAAAFATSCSSDNLATETGHSTAETKTVTLEASIGKEDGTRVGMQRSDGKVQLYWHAGDQISVLTKSKTDATKVSNTMFKMKDGIETGATKATFTGTVADGYEVGAYAVYPYSEAHNFAGEGGITYNLPTSYTYTTVDGNIFSKNADGTTDYPSNSTCMPMLGTITDGKIKFQYQGGSTVIRIDKMPSEKGKVVISADQNLAGNFVITNASSRASQNSSISTRAADGEKQVTFTYSNAKVGEPGVFYLPLTAGNYTGLKISVGSNDTDMKTMGYGNLNVSAKDVVTIPVYQSADGKSFGCDYVVNGHKFIDLCLPSGTLWAETNVGAETAADDGNYYAWGEIEAKSNYSWDTYKYGTENNLTKYASGDSKTVLDNEDDAAYMNWGSFCRMPIPAEFTELLTYCNWEWTTMTTSTGSSINGYKVSSKKNGNSIFLPASGDRNGSAYSDHGVHGNYWSRVLANYGYSYYFRFGINEHNLSDYGFYCSGHSVRPVAKKPGYELDNTGSVDDMDMNNFDDSWK